MLDFSGQFCHYLNTMQKIEKWRIEELALMLNELAVLLKTGNSREWANVFVHFHDESQNIISKEEFDLDSLNKLVKNVKNCFFGNSSFKNIVLWHENSEMKRKINLNLYLIRARLMKILMDIEDRAIVHIN